MSLGACVQRRESEECPICLEDFKEGEPVKRLPCGHLFHAACVKEWIVDVRGVCPLCRQGQKIEAMVNGFGYSKL